MLSAIAAAALLVSVDISDQRMQVYRDGAHVASYDVSTGKPGFETVQGEFKVYRTARMHRSRKYNNARMPYSLFFHRGYAIHQGKVVKGKRLSHGCVRLSKKDARELYGMAMQSQGVAVRVEP